MCLAKSEKQLWFSHLKSNSSPLDFYPECSVMCVRIEFHRIRCIYILNKILRQDKIDEYMMDVSAVQFVSLTWSIKLIGKKSNFSFSTWHFNFGLFFQADILYFLNNYISKYVSSWHIYHCISLIWQKLCRETQHNFLLSTVMQLSSLETAKCAPSFCEGSLIWITQFACQLFVYRPEDTEQERLVQSDREKKKISIFSKGLWALQLSYRDNIIWKMTWASRKQNKNKKNRYSLWLSHHLTGKTDLMKAPPFQSIIAKFLSKYLFFF